ncbi:MAG: HAD-IA family hydrolase [Candidatus Altiarchaeota archaeon]|nr:HAD-IA family hydrolase [Candidatus Altiarchaeota archaeon]
MASDNPFENAEAVLFDLDDTLMRSTYADTLAIHCSIDALRQHQNIEKDDEDLRGMIRYIKKGLNRPSPDSYLFNELLEKLGIGDLSLATRMGIVYRDVVVATMRLYADAIPFLREMYSIGVRTGLVSNGEEFIQREKIIRSEILDYFNTIHVSGMKDDSMKKPYTMIFDRALEALEVSPDEAIYIGDRLDTDILGANKAGLFSIRILREDGRYNDETEENVFKNANWEQEYPNIEIKSKDELKPKMEINSLKELMPYFASIEN